MNRHMNQTEDCNRPQCWCNRPTEPTTDPETTALADRLLHAERFSATMTSSARWTLAPSPPMNPEGPTMTNDQDPFTVQHCAAWCDAVGIGDVWIPDLVAECDLRSANGWDSSWPDIARSIGATYSDGTDYR